MRFVVAVLAVASVFGACAPTPPPAPPATPGSSLHGTWQVDADALATGTPAVVLTDDDPARHGAVLVLGPGTATVYGDDGRQDGEATLAPLDGTRWMLATRTPDGKEHRTIVTPTGPDTATFARAPNGQPLPLRRLPGTSPMP